MTQETDVIQPHLPLGMLSEDEQMLQQSVRRFARKEIAPLAPPWMRRRRWMRVS